MPKYYKEKLKQKKKPFLAKLIEGTIISVVIGIIIIILRPLITTIPIAMLVVGIASLIVSLLLRPSLKAIVHASICAGCTGVFLLNLTPFVGNIYLFQGYKAQMAENWDTAVKEYDKAFHYDPRDGELNFYAGFAYMKKKDYDKASYHFQKSLETKLDPSAFNNLGNVYLEQGEFEAAEEAYKNALYTRVSRMYSLNNLGAVYQKTGRLDESYEMFTQAVEVAPEYEVASKNLEVVENLKQRYAYVEKRYGKEFLSFFISAQSYLQHNREDKAKDFFLLAKDILQEKDENVAPEHPEWNELRANLPAISQVYSVVGTNLVR
ncbi:tetratricopeptide repeat protein, partial [Candidatus Aerophobetes bacterium]|nr:tetratricopeptide repeat protein [Candidatus Aerophobetes bacterium]